MNTRYPGNRWGNMLHTIASLFIGVSLIVSGCSPEPPQPVIPPDQTVANTTIPEPPPAPANEPAPVPAGNITPIVKPEPVPAPAPDPEPQPTPAPAPAPNTTQNTTPPPDPAPTPNATPNATPDETPAPVSFKTVQQRFTMFCATSTCHDGTGNTSLTLMPGVSYNLLVNVPSDFLKGKMRVKPGAPEQSVMMIIINDPEHCTVPQSVIDTIKQWILQGALNN